MKTIIKEAITRNVVWLLDRKGSTNSELAYLETNAVSAYRLDTTFQGSRTSYRLLMFSELFRRTARPDGVTLAEVREQLFSRHGGPPPGAASRLAAEVRRLHSVNDFPQFLREMGIKTIPTAQQFTGTLRQTMRDSVEKGYSSHGLSQPLALVLRLAVEPWVGVQDGLEPWVQEMRKKKKLPAIDLRQVTFFPGRGSRVGFRGGVRSGNGVGRRGRT
jgi:hypothetical protein